MFIILTEEQLAIVNSTESVIVANSVAGSGKSTTAIEFAKARKNKKILYLVFNKSMKDEADKLFKNIDNVTVLTIHGLAYRSVGYRFKEKLIPNYNTKDVNDDLNLNDYTLADSINNHWNKYLSSDYLSIKEYCNNHIKHKKVYNDMLFYLEKLWNLKKDTNSHVKVEHNFYLKYFFTMESDIISKFDVLILDECQDTSYLVQNLFNNAKCNQKLALGDNNQSIMEWNGSINAIKNINGTQYKLSQSHRIGQDSATICNHLYNDYSDEDSFYISGVNSSQKVYPRSHLLPQDFDKCAVLCRTNATVLANAIECAKNGKWLYFLGGIDGYKLDFYVSLYYFSRGTKQKGGVFSKFKDYQDMLDYVEETEDVELLSAIGILKRYNSNLPNFVNLIKEMSIKDKSKANVILSTIHKSKGDTLTVPVLLQDDLIETFHLDAQLLALDFENASDFQVEQFYKSSREELNLLYVAITRAKYDLYLNRDLTNYCKRKGIL